MLHLDFEFWHFRNFSLIQQSTFKAISSERNYIRKIDQIGLFSLSNHRKPLNSKQWTSSLLPKTRGEKARAQNV